MTLTLATLIPGLLLIALGVPLLLNSAGYAAMLKAMPRSNAAAFVLFGTGAAWFIYNIAHLGAADMIIPKPYMLAAFTLIAVSSLVYMREFLAVRGLAALVLVGAMPLLDAGFMNFEHARINFYKAAVYLAIIGAIWIAAQPWRLRDFFGWLLAQPGRTRGVGGVLTAYGVLLAIVAFTY